jgi:hypothetical protein
VAADGTIRITMNKRQVGNSTTAGDVLFHADIGTDIRSIKGTTYFVEGANCTGLLEPVDETGSGSYHVSGNCNVIVGVGPGPGDRNSRWHPAPATVPRPDRAAVQPAGREPSARRGVRRDGRKVCTLLDAERPAGVQHVPFDLEASAGRKLGAGVYLVRMEAGGAERQLRIIGLR